MNSHNFSQGSPNILHDAIRLLRKPAGEDKKFSSFEEIKKNYNEFIIKTHQSYKYLHHIAIENILIWEGALDAASKDKTLDKKKLEQVKQFYKYMRMMWRSINDSLVWVMMGKQKHVAKRLCLHREHGFLAHQNPKGIFKALNKINKDPFALAIWTDATSFVDIGDIFYVNKKNGEFKIFELKDGKVNEEMLSTPMECDRAIYYFLQKYGKKGEEQLKRYFRQMERDIQVAQILNEDKGIDPLSGKNIRVIELKTLDESYDEEISKLIKESHIKTHAFKLLDNCLLCYATTEKKSNTQYKNDFLKVIEKEMSNASFNYLKEMVDMVPYDNIFSLTDGFGFKIYIPIFIREIEAECIIDIIDNKVKVFLYFDWFEFSKLLEGKGAILSWSSKKYGRKERNKTIGERCLIVNDRVPIISRKDAKFYVGVLSIFRIIFDGLRPRAAAGQLAENLNLKTAE